MKAPGGAVIGGVFVPDHLLQLPQNAHLLKLAGRPTAAPKQRRTVALSRRSEGDVVVIGLKGLQLVSELNAREHHHAKARRAAYQRQLISAALLGEMVPALPLVVSIVRSGPRLLDDDNLAGSAKHLRDGVAAWAGVDDSPTSPVTWRYGQVRGGYAVTIEIRPGAPGRSRAFLGGGGER
ncbi:MAG: hypothetical protein JNK72_00275 [Myxococcales bacterium]|nr:hypothetical protein [Myxococcales bacterium]